MNMSQICLNQARIAEKLSEGVKKIIDIESLSRLLLEMSSEFDEAADRIKELESELKAKEIAEEYEESCVNKMIELEAELLTARTEVECLAGSLESVEGRLERVDKLLFGMDEPLQHPVDIDGLNSLFRKLRAAIKGESDE